MDRALAPQPVSGRIVARLPSQTCLQWRHGVALRLQWRDGAGISPGLPVRCDRPDHSRAALKNLRGNVKPARRTQAPRTRTCGAGSTLRADARRDAASSGAAKLRTTYPVKERPRASGGSSSRSAAAQSTSGWLSCDA